MVDVTVVIPLRKGDPVNPIVIGPEDELLIIEGLGAGEARIKGAKDAKNPWIIMADGDAEYPPDYVEKVKAVIDSGKYPYGFKTTRLGGFGQSEPKEAGTIVPRDYFIAATTGFVPDGRWDIGKYFLDQPVVKEVTYYHALTFSERAVVGVGATAALGGAILWLSTRGKRK